MFSLRSETKVTASTQEDGERQEEQRTIIENNRA